MPVTVGSSATAIIDSGMPVILARQDIANGIYGALGVGPGNDGQCECLDIALRPRAFTVATSG